MSMNSREGLAEQFCKFVLVSVHLLLVSFLIPPVLLVAQFTLMFCAGHVKRGGRNNGHHILFITN